MWHALSRAWCQPCSNRLSKVHQWHGVAILALVRSGVVIKTRPQRARVFPHGGKVISQSSLRHRLAGRAFPLAADPRLLDQEVQAQCRIPARGGVAGEVRGVRPPPGRARLCRRECDDPEQGGRPRAVEGRRPRRRRSAPPTRSGSTARRCGRPIPTSKASSTISMPAPPAGTADWIRWWCWAPAEPRAPSSMD